MFANHSTTGTAYAASGLGLSRSMEYSRRGYAAGKAPATTKIVSPLLIHTYTYIYVYIYEFRTHSAEQAPLWGSLVTCVVYCLRVRQC